VVLRGEEVEGVVEDENKGCAFTIEERTYTLVLTKSSSNSFNIFEYVENRTY